MAKENNLKIESFDIKNFKAIRKMNVTIGGRSFLVVGKNGSGKSSLIQAIMSPLSSREIPSVPITEGEERSSVSIVLKGTMHDEPKEYFLDLYFTKADNTGRLVVMNDKMEKVQAPRNFVKDLIGNISFDVMEWLHAEKKKKIDIIKSLSGCSDAINVINVEIEKLKKKKTSLTDKMTDLEGALKNHEFSREDIIKYSSPIPIEPIQQRLNTVSEAQKQWDDVNSKATHFLMSAEQARMYVTKSNAEISRLEALIEAERVKINEYIEVAKINEANHEIAKNWLEANPRADSSLITKEINDAISHNERASRLSMLGAQQKEVILIKDQISETVKAIKQKEDSRADIISKSQLPVDGLTFTDDDLFLDGLPLEDGQQNKTKLFDVGVEVAMALNPNLKVIFLHDGSLYDKDHLNAIIQRIESKGYMAIVEVVSDACNTAAIEFTEKEVRDEQ